MNLISKISFAATVTAPTFMSLGLIGIIKDSASYLYSWRRLLYDVSLPTAFEWWSINLSLLFMLICMFGLAWWLKSKALKKDECKTIKVQNYSNLSQNGADQVVSTIIPWLTLFADELDYGILFICIILQCSFIAIASYNNSNYNLICSILGYRYYEVRTEENNFILLSKRCIHNKKEISKYTEITDYMGLILN